MTRAITEQEQFWAGDFGNQYIGRNTSPQLLASNLQFFSRALRAAQSISSCLELGANVGMNLRALSMLFPGCDLSAVEINSTAAEELGRSLPQTRVFNGSIEDFDSTPLGYDLVFTKGVMIHLNPDSLNLVYDKIHSSTKRYILLAEYYNPTPVAIAYRGHENRLFKRDFAGDMLDRYSDLQLIDYGFAYKRDPSFPQDDISWFLLEKTGQ